MTKHRDGHDAMRVDWDVPIVMDDGLVLRADAFRPPGDGSYPVVLAYGSYAKRLNFAEGSARSFSNTE